MSMRLDRDRLLDHPLRRTIHERVRAEPGVAFTALHERLKSDPGQLATLGCGTLQHHLYRLERAGLVTSRRSGRHRRYYENGGSWNGDTTDLSLLQCVPVARLVHVLLAEPGLSQSGVWARVCGETASTRQAVGYHLARLAERGLVTVTKVGRRKIYYATEKTNRLGAYVQRPAQTSVAHPLANAQPAQVAPEDSSPA